MGIGPILLETKYQGGKYGKYKNEDNDTYCIITSNYIRGILVVYSSINAI